MEKKPGLSRLGRAQFPIEKELDFAEYLVDLKRANRINKGNLKSEVFPTIVQKFAEKGSIFDDSQIRAKYYALRSQTYEYNRMRLRVTDAGWDPMKMTITMDEEKWVALLQENPSFEAFKDKDCRVFYMLTKVFDKMDVQRRYSRDSGQPSVDINEEIRARQRRAAEHVDDSKDEILPKEPPRKPKVKQMKGKGKRNTPEPSIQETELLLGLSRSSYNNATAWRDATFAARRSTSASVDAPPPPSPRLPRPPSSLPLPPTVHTDDGPFGVTKANEALNAIEQLPDKVFVTAAAVLTESEAHRITFLSQKSEARRRLYALKIGGGELDD